MIVIDYVANKINVNRQIVRKLELKFYTDSYFVNFILFFLLNSNLIKLDTFYCLKRRYGKHTNVTY